MKTESKKIDSTTKEISVEISGDIVKNKFDDVFKRIANEAKVPGFRAGHAPRDILEKHYSSDAHRMVIKELTPDAYGQAIEKEGIEAIDLPEIFDVRLDRNTLFFKAKVEVSPEIKISDYKGIKVHYKKIEVTGSKIKSNIDYLREARKAVTADERFARALGYPSLAELESAAEKQIYIQEANLQRQKIEEEIIQGITQALEVKLPQSLVNRQLQDLLRQAKLDLALKGVPREKIEEGEKELAQQLEPQAKRQVKIYLVLAAIAKKEGIPQDEHMAAKVMEFLLGEADWVEAA